MSNDISSEFTKLKNKQDGRKGYYAWKREKISEISPKDYGMFIQKKKKKKK